MPDAAHPSHPDTAADPEGALLWRLITIAQSLSSERDRWKLYEQILLEAQKVSRAEGSTLYLLNQENRPPTLDYVIVRNEPLNISILNRDQQASGLQPLPLYDGTHHPNHHNIATHCALSKQVVNIDDIYQCTTFDTGGILNFDRQFQYRTFSILSVPLVDHDNHVCGVIQLINAHSDETDTAPVAFSEGITEIVKALCSLAAIAIDNHVMMEEQRDLLIRLASKKETSVLFETILDEAQSITNAEGGTLYLFNEAHNPPCLDFAIIKNLSLGVHYGGTSPQVIPFPPLPLYDAQGAANYHNIATYTALSKQLVNIPDAYNNDTFDFQGTRRFDEQANYRSVSFLCVPLINHAQDVIGVLQLVNARHPISGERVPFDSRLQPLIMALGTYAAIALENQILLEDHKKLLEAFIQCIARAIDAKSPHTSAHCQRVPVLTEMIARATCNDSNHFPDFDLSEDEWYELHVASWLHDCGKLSTPDTILDKSTKLHTLRDGIETIDARMETMARDIDIERLQLQVAGELSAEKDAELTQRQEQLRADQAFLKRANKGGEFMAAEDQQRVRDISRYQWRNADGEWQTILDEEEVFNLCIERGTLNSREREKINDHMRVTIDMLESLPFPKTLRRVPEYAGGHHEKMDGSGFPRGLTRDQMSLPARMMAIADIFEALTSKERPYKAPMKISQALSILQRMRDQNHIDPDLYQVFLEQRVWEVYASQQLNPDQLDVLDITAYR